MTNAEKFKDIFGISIYTVASICKGEYMACEFCKNDTCTAQWWNTEYKEPITKNNLGVDCTKKSNAINIIQDMHGLARADVISDAINRIIELPSVTLQEPKTGHWIKVHPLQPNDEGDYMCSVCRCGGLTYKPTKFCPNCGAKMVEPQESEERNDNS